MKQLADHRITTRKSRETIDSNSVDPNGEQNPAPGQHCTNNVSNSSLDSLKPLDLTGEQAVKINTNPNPNHHHPPPPRPYLSSFNTHISSDHFNRRPIKHHSFVSEVPDVKHMEQTLFCLLDDFHSSKLNAFGMWITERWRERIGIYYYIYENFVLSLIIKSFDLIICRFRLDNGSNDENTWTTGSLS